MSLHTFWRQKSSLQICYAVIKHRRKCHFPCFLVCAGGRDNREDDCTTQEDCLQLFVNIFCSDDDDNDTFICHVCFHPLVSCNVQHPCCSKKRKHLQYIYTYIHILLKKKKRCNLKSMYFLNRLLYSSEYYLNI